MKRNPVYLILILILLFINSCSMVQEKPAAPAWYVEQGLRGQSFEVIGYGDAGTMEEAKRRARSDVVRKINVIVESNWKEIQNCRQNPDAVMDCKYEVLAEIREQASMELDDVRVLKQQVVGDQYFIALRFVNLPIARKILYEIEADVGDICSPGNRLPYYAGTPLAKKLKSALGCEPALSLVRTRGLWYVAIGDRMIRLSQADFTELWSGQRDVAVSLETVVNSSGRPEQQVSRGDYFHLRVASQETGYLSLFVVYNTGQTVSLRTNVRVEGGTNLTYPDLNNYEGLIADIPEGQTNTRDLYLAVLCPSPRDFDRYEPIDEKLLASENAYQFGALIGDIDGCRLSGRMMHTRQKGERK
ncbi:hypothetical protein KKI24_11740 [bacterium]|nr:hypothetical protein [bacterium]